MQDKTYLRKSIPFLVIAVGVLAPQSRGQNAPSPDDFANSTIDQLMNIDVTTASRKEQKLSKIPAAVYVLTQEAIQRSGATNIPDLLRLVPGVQVAQLEADRWAISIRGFNASYSNKLLVLIDGRTVYTPSFSGVYWDQIDVPLDTIDRIEVVRGSGGAVWGANAVDGVINIITFHSRDTQGGRVEAGSGSHLAEDFDARYGGTLGSFGTYRFFGDYHDLNGLPSTYIPGRHDGWNMGHGGFRVDTRLSSADQLSIDGDVFNTDGGQLLAFAANASLGAVPSDLDNHGFHAMTRWTHTYSDDSESSLQIYDSQYQRFDTGSNERSNTLDIDFQNRSQVGSSNDLVWGAGYRSTTDRDRTPLSVPDALAKLGLVISLHPEAAQYSLFSGFLQDEIAITPSLALTLGSKLEHNDFSGFAVEPTVRLGWTPTGHTTLWAAASHAVRQPSRVETGVSAEFADLPVAPGVLLRTSLAPNPHIPAESAETYEAGYRAIPCNRLSFDFTGFLANYRNLTLYSPETPGLLAEPEALVLNLPSTYSSSGSARNFGSETAVTWNAAARWKITGSYSWLRQRSRTGLGAPSLGPLPGLLPPALMQALSSQLANPTIGAPLSGSAPENAFGIQSYFDLTAKASFDQLLFYTGKLQAPDVPAYYRLDAHFSYKLGRGVQATLVGQNLLSPRHLEFSEPGVVLPTEVERSVFGKLTWSF